MIVYEKGYQEFQKPYSSVTTKVKGLSLTNLTNNSNPLALYGGVHVWDSSDFVIPPEVITMIIILLLILALLVMREMQCPHGSLLLTQALSSPGSSPGLGHCVVFLGKTLTHLGVKMGTDKFNAVEAVTL